jgi:hypothetical protein
MVVSQNPCAEGDALPRKEGQAAQYLSFTSIYDVCKSAKGVRLNGDSMLAVFTGIVVVRPGATRRDAVKVLRRGTAGLGQIHLDRYLIAGLALQLVALT